MRSLVLMLAAILVGCSGDSSKATTPPGGDDDDDDGTPTTESAHTGGGAPDAGINPVAVGFELVATVEADGSLGAYDYDDGGGLNAPRLIMTFADAEYFQGGVANYEDHICVVVAFMTDPYTVNPIPAMPKPGPQLDTRSHGKLSGDAGTDGALLYWGYDMQIVALAETIDTPCGGRVDPELWGENAEGLVDPWLGAHVGVGFGQMTEYLMDYWLADGETTNDFVAEYGPAMMAGYVAINDANGDFLAYDWTTSILFQNEPDTNVTITEPDDEGNEVLVPLPVDSVPAGGNLPEGYVQSYAYWYQDFYLLDFSNLTDGAPTYPPQ